MKEYPYIQNKKPIIDFVCEGCNQHTAKGFRVEWRVDIFQGNCEFMNYCESCLVTEIKTLKEQNIKARQEWQKQENGRIRNLENLEKKLVENGITIKKYPDTGQWVLNNIIDWWTTTGTAINRKTKQRFNLSVHKPDKILNLLNPNH